MAVQYINVQESIKFSSADYVRNYLVNDLFKRLFGEQI